jgi:methionine-R-sulfoxide reductase
MAYNELNEEEQRVILRKGTEMAFTGEFWNHKENGIYTCKQCNTPLFKSDDKFDSGTGWPSFDDMIDDNVEELRDADGMRVEIVCKNCGGHLGHVFRVAHRLGLAEGKTVEQVEEQLVKKLKDDLHIFHQAMVLFGRYVCKATSPDCDNCALVPVCKSKGRFSANGK